MSGKKGMKKYPVGIREEVIARIRQALVSESLAGNMGLADTQYKAG